VVFAPVPSAVPLWGYPADSSVRAIVTAPRLRRTRPAGQDAGGGEPF
jgi:hypothetical protein